MNRKSRKAQTHFNIENKLKGKHLKRQTGRQTDRQADRQTDRQTVIG